MPLSKFVKNLVVNLLKLLSQHFKYLNNLLPPVFDPDHNSMTVVIYLQAVRMYIYIYFNKYETGLSYGFVQKLKPLYQLVSSTDVVAIIILN